jgi:hypothetical protein
VKLWDFGRLVRVQDAFFDLEPLGWPLVRWEDIWAMLRRGESCAVQRIKCRRSIWGAQGDLVNMFEVKMCEVKEMDESTPEVRSLWLRQVSKFCASPKD